MPRNVNARYLAMLVMCVLCLAGAYHTGVTTMATSIVTTNSNRKLATTTPVAQAPHTHAAPTLPSTLPAGNWQLVGSPSTAKQATNGIGPAPKQGTVGYAALACITAAGKAGATVAQVQAAITAVGLKGKHPAMPLLTWLAKNRGYTFVCTNGNITLG